MVDDEIKVRKNPYQHTCDDDYPDRYDPDPHAICHACEWEGTWNNGCMIGQASPHPYIFVKREDLLKAILDEKNEPHIITSGGLLQNRYIQIDIVTHLINTLNKENANKEGE